MISLDFLDLFMVARKIHFTIDIYLIQKTEKLSLKEIKALYVLHHLKKPIVEGRHIMYSHMIILNEASVQNRIFGFHSMNMLINYAIINYSRMQFCLD